MMIDKSDRKINTAVVVKEMAGIWKTAAIAGMTVVCFRLAGFTLSVQAAPATLTSPDAVVYEQAQEGSSPVGNLVEGSTFEYIGDVTAADGSVWHQIVTASGENGYIRGDSGMETGAEESAPEEQGVQEDSLQENSLEESESVTAGNERVDDGEEADMGELRENDGGHRELSEVNEGIEESGSGGLEAGGSLKEGESLEDIAAAAIMNIQNNQAKTYVLASSGKVKERESIAGPGPVVQDMKRAKAQIDTTLLTGIAIVIFCTMAIHICLTRMKMLRCGTEGRRMPDTGRGHRKIDKKKRRKVRKAVQMRKEGVKTPKEKN